MEVIIAVQFCAIGLFLYLLNSNNNQIWRLKNEQRNKDDEIRNLLYTLEQSKNENSKLALQFQNSKNFLRKPTVNVRQDNKNRREIEELKRQLQTKNDEIRQLQYSLNRSETSQLYQKINENETVIKNLQHQLNEKEKEIYKLHSELQQARQKIKEPIQIPLLIQSTNDKRFVQVIFQKYSHDRYDYLLGNNSDVKVGDYVKVWANGKQRRAKVLKISNPGEVSSYAKTPIIEKIY